MDCKYWLKFCQLLFLVTMCHSDPILDKATKIIDKEAIKKNLAGLNNNVASLIHRFFGPEKVVIHIPVEILKSLNGTNKYETVGSSFPYKFEKDGGLEVSAPPHIDEVEYHGLNTGEKQQKNSVYEYKHAAPASSSAPVEYEVEHTPSIKANDEGKYFMLENGVLKEVTPDEVARHYQSTGAHEASQVKRDYGEIKTLTLAPVATTPAPAVYTLHKTVSNVKPIPVYKLLGYKLADSNIGALEVVDVNNLYKPKKAATLVDLSSLKLKAADTPKAQPVVLVQAPNLNSYGQKTNIQWKLPKGTAEPGVSPVKINYAPIQTIIHNHEGYQSVAKQSPAPATGHGGGSKPNVHFHYETANSPQYGVSAAGGHKVVFSSPSAGGGSYYAAPKPVPQPTQPTGPTYQYFNYNHNHPAPTAPAQNGYAKASSEPASGHNSGYEGQAEQAYTYGQEKSIFSHTQGLPAPQPEVPHPSSGGYISNGYYVRPPTPTAPVYEQPQEHQHQLQQQQHQHQQHQQQQQQQHLANQPNYGYPALPTSDPSYVYQAVAQQNQHQYSHQEQPHYSVQSQEKWSQPISSTPETHFSSGGDEHSHAGTFSFQPSVGPSSGDQDKLLVIIAGKNGQPQLVHQSEYENEEDDDDNGETYGYFLQEDNGHSESRQVPKQATNRNDWRLVRRNGTRTSQTKNSRSSDSLDSSVRGSETLLKVEAPPTAPAGTEWPKETTKRDSSDATNSPTFLPSPDWNPPFKAYEGAKVYDLNTFSAVQEYLNQKNASTTMLAPTILGNGLPPNHRTALNQSDATTRYDTGSPPRQR